jgi:hypothetical protein
MPLSLQFAQQMGQIHFGIRCLEALLQSRLHLALGLGFEHTLAEQIGIATDPRTARFLPLLIWVEDMVLILDGHMAGVTAA